MSPYRSAIALTALLLAACGGGGSGTSAPPATTPSPQPSAPTTPPDTTPVPPPVTTPETPPTTPPVVQPPDTPPSTPPVVEPGTPTSPPVTPPATQPETPPVLPPVKPPVTPPPATSAIEQALATGDASPLSDDDMAILLQRALQGTRASRVQQQSLIADLIDDQTVAPLDFTTNSHNIRPLLATSAAPFLVSDNGNVLASIGTAQGGRAIGYGKDLLKQLSTPSGPNQAQLPLFTRSFTWLVTGKAKGTLPTTVRFVAQNYDANAVINLVKRLGSTAEKIDCNLTDSANTCWQNADVMVFGPGTPNTPLLGDLVRGYLKAGKGVTFLHDNWTESAGGRTVLQAMGMRLGDAPGNFYADKTLGVQISASRTAAQQRAATDLLGLREAAITQLVNGDLVDFSQDTTLVKGLDGIRSDLAALEGRGVNMFADDYAEKSFMPQHRELVLWADLYRRKVDYSKVKRSDAGPFFRTLAADTLSFAMRPVELAPKNFGDWMPASAPTLASIDTWEALNVTIAQSGGQTLIGRGAIPGKAVQVEIVDAAGANLGLRVGKIRARGNPLTQEAYTRPRNPDGHYAGLVAGKTQSYVTAWGGALMLDYSNAKPGTVVKLRVRGSTKYAHFDFTQNPSQQELDDAVAALKRADFGWQTAKFVGGEIQQTIGLAKGAIGNRAPEEYVQVRIRDMIFNSNHLANGYNNIAPSANVASTCASLGWDCTSDVHRAPGVQHFVGWIATCGFLCSGNPADGFAGISPGWGWWHELGHNTVPKVMTLPFPGGGCIVECNNNILANASALRQYALTGGKENNNGQSIDHKRLYQDIAKALATGKTGAALQQEVYNGFWVGSNRNDQAMRAVHFQLAFIYTRERLGLVKPTPGDTIDFLGLISRGNRLIDQTWSDQNKASLGMGRFAKKDISNQDMLYVLSSMIIGRDMRKLFEVYGLPVGQTALDSIADRGLPVEGKVYYAMPVNQGNQVTEGQWLNLEGAIPTYPF